MIEAARARRLPVIRLAGNGRSRLPLHQKDFARSAFSCGAQCAFTSIPLETGLGTVFQ